MNLVLMTSQTAECKIACRCELVENIMIKYINNIYLVGKQIATKYYGQSAPVTKDRLYAVNRQTSNLCLFNISR